MRGSARSSVLNRQYWSRAISALSEDFPTLNAVIGPRRFDTLILAYLKENPSTSWMLRDLGAKLPVYLEEHPEFTGNRHSNAADVAKLEWAYVDAFDSKYLRPLTAEDICATGPSSKLFLQPHLQPLALNYPVDTLVLAAKKGTTEADIVSGAASQRDRLNRIKLPSIKRQRVYLAVHRLDDSVYYRRLERWTFTLLNALRSDVCIAEAVLQAFRRTKLTAGERADLLRESFAHACELGWLCPHRDNEGELLPFVM